MRSQINGEELAALNLTEPITIACRKEFRELRDGEHLDARRQVERGGLRRDGGMFVHR